MLGDPVFWGLAILGVLITGISKSGFAGGAGVVAVPLLSIEVGVLNATAITLPLLLAMDAQTLGYYRKHVSFNELKALIPGALFGIALGGLFMGFFSDQALMIALGLLSILFALWGSLQKLAGNLRGARLFWSSLSGLSSTLVHAGGPPINIYLIGRKLPKLQWLATAGAFFALMNVTKLIPYSLNQQWSTDLLVISALLLPIAILGVWSGKQIQKWMNEQHFLLACKGLLLLSGTALILKSF